MEKHIVFSLLLILLCISGFAQEQVISIHAENKSLNTVLEEISATYHTPFAFDADYFSTINVTIHQNKISVTDFLALLSDRYHLLFEKIENTYVLYEPPPLPQKKPEFITLKGQVIDQTTGEPLLFCTVAYDENLGTITNELRIFNEKIAKTDEVAIQISHLGYQRLDSTINIVPDKFHQITLEPFAIHIETIEVHQQEKNVIEMGKQNGRMAFNPKQSENLPQIDDNDLVTSLSLIPGVNFLSRQSSGISIRGGSPSENLILLDGMPVLETSLLFGNLSVLNAKYISQAFVSRAVLLMPLLVNGFPALLN
ncbi:TonB-dependent receptor plug domain-containing protein [uncultured Sunxiuqinia sp.]|uniref:TonB-dependent receptor plug domain-containing protein n=1 Tax=uncultured Sunxiuqinia sp. TaxID=1573825 RepID=UPI002AA8FB87|nr:TonB-dependent receptor plug domain-containing protein [uncultured Sunxiuqinia sp.]